MEAYSPTHFYYFSSQEIDRLREAWCTMQTLQLWESKKSVLMWKPGEIRGLPSAIFQTRPPSPRLKALSTWISLSDWRFQEISSGGFHEINWCEQRDRLATGRHLFKSKKHIIYSFIYLKTRCILKEWHMTNQYSSKSESSVIIRIK